MTHHQDYWTVADLAARWRRSPRTVRDWVRGGCPVGSGRAPLPAVKAGKSYLVADEDRAVFELRLARATERRPELELRRGD